MTTKNVALEYSYVKKGCNCSRRACMISVSNRTLPGSLDLSAQASSSSARGDASRR